MALINWLLNLAHNIVVEYYSSGRGNGETKHDDDLTDGNVLQEKVVRYDQGFRMPLHYPRYKKADYEKMEEWKLDLLLGEYGLLNFEGSLDEKKRFAMGAFLWPDHYF